jgi:hypothetical protein
MRCAGRGPHAHYQVTDDGTVEYGALVTSYLAEIEAYGDVSVARIISGRCGVLPA